MQENLGTTQLKLQSLAEVASLINSSLETHTVLANAMSCVQTLLDAEASTIFEFDRDSCELFFRTPLGEAAEKLRDVRLKLGEGIAGWVAQTGEPLIILDAQNDPRFLQAVDSITGFTTRSILCAPMTSKGHIVGVLEVLNKQGERNFNESDLEMLMILGHLIAIALENAKLYTRLSEKFALTEAELKVTQDKLIRSERLAALARLSQGVAHEVRNPAMVIGGFARRLQKHFSDLEPVSESAAVILRETERLERMVTDIENLYKLRSPILQPVAMGTVLDRVLQSVVEPCRSRGIDVKQSSCGRLQEIQADAELLEIALGNVVENAIEAMPNGGMLDIGIVSQPEALVITTKDTGTGISPQDLPNVFDPFFTSKTRGSGLGLTTAHRIVTEHKGEISISSVVGHGTEVTMVLPTGALLAGHEEKCPAPVCGDET